MSTIEQLAVGFFGLTSSGKLSRFRNTVVRFFGLIFSVAAILFIRLLTFNESGRIKALLAYVIKVELWTNASACAPAHSYTSLWVG